MPYQPYTMGFGTTVRGGGSGMQTGFKSTFDPMELEQQTKSQERLQAPQLQGDLARSQIAANAQMFPAQQKQNRFNVMWPWMQQQYANLTAGGPFRVGGQSDQPPPINVGGVWDTNQTQQQVNAMKATTDQATAAKTRESAQNLGAKGMGAQSPLQDALAAQYGAAGLGANVAGERQIRGGMAEANAKQLLATQQARSQQWEQSQQQDIARRQMAFQQQNALLAALSGLAA